MMLQRILFVLLAIPAQAVADVDMRFSDGSSMLVKAGRVLFGDGANAVLYAGERDGLVVMNEERQSYVVMKPGFAEQIAERMTARLESVLPSLPEDQRALARQQIEDLQAQARAERPDYSVRSTGHSGEAAGYDCNEVEIVDDEGNPKEIVCVASAAQLSISHDDFKSLSEFMNRLAEIASPDDDALIDLEILGGVPIRSENLDYGDQSELVSISTAAIETARLEIPESYTEASIDTMIGQ